MSNRYDIELYITYHAQCKSVTLTADNFGVNLATMWRILKDHGIDTSLNKEAFRVRQTKIKVNDNYFETINNHEKAYILGFIYADGHMFKNRKQIRFKIADIDILELIADKLNYNRSYIKKCKYKAKVHHKDQYEIRICNFKMFDDLIKLGVHRNKTFNCNFPTDELVPLEFKSSFIRGYFDGDGHIYYNPNIALKAEASLIGTVEFCNNYKLFLKNIGIESTFKIDKKIDSRVTQVRIRDRKELLKFYNYIYKDKGDMFLNRKFEKFTRFIKEACLQ